MTSILGILVSFFGAWAFFKYVIIKELRVDSNTFKTLYDLLKTSEKKFILDEEFITEAKYPNLYNALCYVDGAPFFYLRHGERLLQAGWYGKDYVTIISCFRWKRSKLKDFLTTKLKKFQTEELGVPVEILTPHYTDKIGSIKEMGLKPLHEEELWEDFEKEVAEVAAQTRKKTGAILYGAPGNGKTSFIKYLATKYNLPIKLVVLSPEYSNTDIMFMFSQITSRCIVLLEDFDNYFEGRKCIIGGDKNTSIKFTFDVMLNVLDGVYNTYENVVFIMTANDISKVDIALKSRPSRFKYMKEFGNPSKKVRTHLLNGWADHTDGLNLDQIVRLSEFKQEDCSLEEATSKLKADVVENIAKDGYKERLKKMIGIKKGT